MNNTPRVKESKLSNSTTASTLGYEEIVRKALPGSFKAGRDGQLQLASLDRNLFSDVEEQNSGNYIVSGITKQVNSLDFAAVTLALTQTLSNQSYQSGNEEKDASGRLVRATGLSKDFKANKISSIVNEEVYAGHIKTSLADLARKAYGVETPDYRQKKAVASMLKLFNDNPVEIRFPNGDVLEATICSTLNKLHREKDGAILYELLVNPIFTLFHKGYIELPQDITQRLSAATKKKTHAHYRLLQLLAIQDKNKPFHRTREQLLTELGLEEQYKKNKGRTELQIRETIDTMQRVGIITSCDISHKVNKGRTVIDRFTFYLNKDFIRDAKKLPEGKTGAEE